MREVEYTSWGRRSLMPEPKYEARIAGQVLKNDFLELLLAEAALLKQDGELYSISYRTVGGIVEGMCPESQIVRTFCGFLVWQDDKLRINYTGD